MKISNAPQKVISPPDFQEFTAATNFRAPLEMKQIPPTPAYKPIPASPWLNQLPTSSYKQVSHLSRQITPSLNCNQNSLPLGFNPNNIQDDIISLPGYQPISPTNQLMSLFNTISLDDDWFSSP